MVLCHDLPSRPLAAWFYKCDEGSGGTAEHDMLKAADNAGEGLALLCCPCESGAAVLCRWCFSLTVQILCCRAVLSLIFAAAAAAAADLLSIP